jgi:lysophospholipase L1-like esterase
MFDRLIVSLLCLMAVPAMAAEPFELKDGDRVVFVGNTLFERAANHGYLQTAFLTRWADRKLTFRNLGWSADDVRARSRDYFFKKGDGYKRLIKQVTELKPTVVFVAYGTNESFAGKAGLDAFKRDLAKLLDDLGKTNARFVLLSPMKQAAGPFGAPVDNNNANLKLYGDAIKAEAAKRKHRFVDLFADAKLTTSTYNSIHLDDSGYRYFAQMMEKALGLKPIKRPDTSAIRKLVVQKSEQFFYQWRPANETYLFGHRKREQGRNGKEMPMFTPLIEAKEKQIDALRAKLAGGGK